MTTLETIIMAREHVDVGWIALLLLPVAIALAPPWGAKWSHKALRTLYAVAITWPLLLIYRIEIDVPWMLLELDYKNPENGYDGNTGNVVVMLFGWVPPLLLAGIPLLVIHFVQKLKTFQQRSERDSLWRDSLW